MTNPYTPEKVAELAERLRSIAESQRMDFDSPHVGMTLDESAVALTAVSAERDAERERADEVQEKVAYLRRACMRLPEQELRQKISAVGAAEWRRGYYWNTLVAEERDRASRAEQRERITEAKADRLHKAITEALATAPKLGELRWRNVDRMIGILRAALDQGGNDDE